MVYLHEIANEDFLLLDAELSAALAQEASRRLAPTAVVVRRRGGQQGKHHLYTTEDFTARLATVPGHLGLFEALGLDDSNCTPTLDAYADAEAAPERCVILDGDRVVSFLDDALPPPLGLRVGAVEGGEVPLSIEVYLPDPLMVGHTCSLVVWAVRSEALSRSPSAMQPGTSLDIVVHPRRGLALDGRREASLVVTSEAETPRLQFKVRATERCRASVDVLCFHAGQEVCRMRLERDTAPEEMVPEERHKPERRPIAALLPAQPDLMMHFILAQNGHTGCHEILLRVTAADQSLDINLKQYGPMELRADPRDFFDALHDKINQLPLATISDRTLAREKLARIGADLFENLLPEELRSLLWSLQRRIKTILVQSEEPWIPWELLRMTRRDEHGHTVEGPHLCEAFAMTRWIPNNRGMKHALGALRRIALVTCLASSLPYAEKERKFIRSLSRGGREIEDIPASWLSVIDAMKKGTHDAWHFTGHGRRPSMDMGAAAIMLDNGDKLTSDDISGTVQNCGKTRPVVVLNACHSGRQELSLTGLGGFARAFVHAGAAAVVGPIWAVDDYAAYRFTRAFYARLLEGATVGEATRDARAVVRRVDPVAALAFTVFANPSARVQR
ncbi:CHAT domain-containing protein [Sorangium sp. So ce1153]|uniref:CHAT domain-containing protein n=1 Tax=Sorangium sp. So ce1153 TaxID=3133333 RepID=UPI003F6127FD